MPSYRSLTLAALAVGALITVGGCGSDKRDGPDMHANPQPVLNNLPDFVKDPTKGGSVIGASGSCQKSPGQGFDAQKKYALQNARSELAQSIETKIQAAVKTFEQTAGEVYRDADKTMTLQFRQTVSKGMANMALQNSIQKDIWQEPTSGELFVWVVLDPKIAEQIPKKVAQDYKRQMEDKMGHIAAKLEAQKAFEAMEADVQKELNGGVAPAPVAK